MESHTSALVIGGGPGGSTVAALLAKNGVDVLLLEREQFPRYHIGESLLASCLPTLRLSGAFEKVAAEQFTVKRGALIHWAEDTWVLDWKRLIGEEAWSWQVDRATYDNVLLRNAAAQGAKVVEKATVRRVIFDGDRAVAAEWTCDGDPAVRVVHFDHVFDASGRSGLLAKHLDLREQHKIFQNVAIWSYWEGASLLPDSPEGAINVISTPDGWWWHIPLKNNRFSVGLVTHKSLFSAQRKQYSSLDEYYHSKVQSTPKIALALANAKCVKSARADQDYSYVSKQFCGPGYFLIGDAACFLDPLLSTGVHLAQYSAMLAAATALSIRRAEVSESEGSDFYDYIYRRAYARMLVLVSRLYEMYTGKDDYFWSAQQLVHEKVRDEEAVTSFTQIMTGLSDVSEATNVDRRLLNQQLIAEAERCQNDKVARSGGANLHALDVEPTWGPWRNLIGPDTTAGDIYLVTEPDLGLRRNRAEATTQLSRAAAE